MNRSSKLALLLLLFTSTFSPAVAEETVVTTLPSLASIAREIGGDRIDVHALCRGYEDPHYIQPKPSYARTLRKAILLVYGGLELEVGWLPPLLDTARNPRISPGSKGLLEAAAAVEHVLEVPDRELSRAEGDIHPYGNPHFMLDPRNALAVASLLAERLGEVDPDGRQFYLDGAAAFQTRLRAKIAEWETRTAEHRGHPVVAYHKQWEYLANWLQMDVVDYIESKAGIPPAPRHVASVIDLIEQRDIEVVFAATFVDLDAAEKVATRGGARLVVLPAEVGGVEGTDNYIELMDTIVDRIAGSHEE